MNQQLSGIDQGRSGSVLRTALLRACSGLLAALLLFVAAAAEAAGKTWEERMAEAREKYNSRTVNVFVNGRGRRKKGKINAYFYKLKKRPYMAIRIDESLQITDEAEIEAVLEVIMENKNYQEEIYGTVSFMKAQWVAHNLAHSMATGTEEQQQMIKMIVGESLSSIITSAKALDLSPIEEIDDRQMTMYEVIEFILSLNGH
jgi:hypothetical protein